MTQQNEEHFELHDANKDKIYQDKKGMKNINEFFANKGKIMLVDGDLLAYRITSSLEEPIDWGDDIWTLWSDLKKGKQLFNLKNEDHLIKVIELNKSHLACVNSEAKLLIFETKTLPRLQKGGGVQLQKIKTNVQLKDIQNFNLEQGINWKTGSFNKNEKLLDFWIGKRAQSGKKVPKRFNKNLKFYDYDK